MSKLRLALISGGTSNEREVALAGADAVANALNPERYDVTRYDPATDIARIVEDASEIEFAFLVIHGENGEDGRLQGLLDLLGIPYQGSGVLGSALACNKLAAKEIFTAHGLTTPPWRTFTACTPDLPQRLVAELGLPLVIKPADGGSSLGMSIVNTAEEVAAACALCLENGAVGLAERYIKGVELTCAVMGNAAPNALPVIEIVPDTRFTYFDYTAKYTPGATNEICPARIDAATTRKVQELAEQAHRLLHCKGYSRSDFIFMDNTLYLLETNTLPGMTETSLLPLAARTAGISFPNLIDRLIELRLEEGPKSPLV